MQHPTRGALPAAPADYEDFLRKLGASRSPGLSQPWQSSAQSALSSTSGVGLKRSGDGNCGNLANCPAKPALSKVPRVQPKVTFYHSSTPEEGHRHSLPEGATCGGRPGETAGGGSRGNEPPPSTAIGSVTSAAAATATTQVAAAAVAVRVRHVGGSGPGSAAAVTAAAVAADTVTAPSFVEPAAAASLELSPKQSVASGASSGAPRGSAGGGDGSNGSGGCQALLLPGPHALTRPVLAVRGAAPRGEFRLQQQAFEYLDTQGELLAHQLRVFGAELSGDGKRRFLVTSPQRLWAEDVEAAPPGSCHLYEIIREGAPCHLYFDLEYSRELNPGLCGDSLVDSLIALVAEELAVAFRIQMPLTAVVAATPTAVEAVTARVAAATVAIPMVAMATAAMEVAQNGKQWAGDAAGSGSAGRWDQLKQPAGAQRQVADEGEVAEVEEKVNVQLGAAHAAETADAVVLEHGQERRKGQRQQEKQQQQQEEQGWVQGEQVPEQCARAQAGSPARLPQRQQEQAVLEAAPQQGAPEGEDAGGSGSGGGGGRREEEGASTLGAMVAEADSNSSSSSSIGADDRPLSVAAEVTEVALKTGARSGPDGAAAAAGNVGVVGVSDDGASGGDDAHAGSGSSSGVSGGGVSTSSGSGGGGGGGVECSWVWELCSTTAAKWSRHVVVRIPHCAFKDNFHVNAFVRRLFDRIAADRRRFAPFFVRRSPDPAAPPTLFIDPAVYTRNRAFRLYLSSKAGKAAVLRATTRHAVAALLRRRGLLPVDEAALAAAAAAAVQQQAGSGAGMAAAVAPATNVGVRVGASDPSAATRPAPATGSRDTGLIELSAAATGSRVTDGMVEQATAVEVTAANRDGRAGACEGAAGGGGPGTGVSGGSESDCLLLPPRVERLVARDVFFATLVTSVGRVDRVLSMYDDVYGSTGGGGGGARGIGNGSDGGGSDGGAGLARFHAAASAAAAGAQRQEQPQEGQEAMPMELCLSIPRLPLPGGCRGGGGSNGGGGGWGSRPGREGFAAYGGGGGGEAFRYGASPFPEVEQFIESVCREGGVQGHVRSWQHHTTPAASTSTSTVATKGAAAAGASSLLLGIRDNRWCANVGRAHRSNGVYYVVDLRAGVWCQRCHDPECRDFRSAAMPLPQHVWDACRPKEPPPPQQPQPQHHHQQPQSQPLPQPPQLQQQCQRQQRPQQPQAVPIAAGATPPPVTMAGAGCAASRGGGGGDRGGGDGFDDDLEHDMLCVQALERLERLEEGAETAAGAASKTSTSAAMRW